MRNGLAKFQPSPWLLRKLLMLVVLAGVATAAFCWGRWQNAEATPPFGQRTQVMEGPFIPGSSDGDYQRRVVAYLYNNIPVGREELGEYLIARFGADRLEFMINRKIVETEAKKYNIYVTDAEVEARFQRDLNSFGQPLTEKDFVNNILRRFGKTLYEWKEDVIRPKLMMEKLVTPMVQRSLSDKDLQEGFEARYGPKVECRMIVLDKNDGRILQKVWEDARKSREAFLEQARKQFIPNLAQYEGKVPPIHKHFGDVALEDAAFRLKEGEISGLIQLKDGTTVILLCEKHLPASVSHRFETERTKLTKEMEELRVAQKIPEVFAEMRKAANPRFVLVPAAPQTASVQVPPPSSLAQEAATMPLPPSKDMPPAPVPQPVTPRPLAAVPQPMPNATTTPPSGVQPSGGLPSGAQAGGVQPSGVQPASLVTPAKN